MAGQSLTFGLSVGTATNLLARISGLVRNFLVAYFFGASIGVDFFHMANAAIFFFFFIFQEVTELKGIPFIMKDGKWREGFWSVFLVATFFSTVALCFIFLTPEWMLGLIASNYTDQQITDLVPYLHGITIGGFLGLLNFIFGIAHRSLKDYLNSSVQELVISLGVTSFLIIHHPTPLAICYAFSFGHLLGFAFNAYTRRKEIFPIIFDWKTIKEFIIEFRKIILIPLVGNFFVIIEKNYASGLAPGHLSAVSYAVTLVGLFYSVIPFASIFYPTLNEEPDKLDEFLKLTSFFSIPVSCFLFFHAHDFVDSLLAYGKLKGSGAALVSTALQVVSIHLFFSFSNQLFSRMFYIKRKEGMHLWLTIINLFSTATLYFIFRSVNLEHYGLAAYHVLIAIVPFAVGVTWLYRNNIFLSLSTYQLIIKNLIFSLVASFVLISVTLENPILSLAVKGIFYLLFLSIAFFLFYQDELSRKIRYKGRELANNMIFNRLK